jgi:hypothetical protein
MERLINNFSIYESFWECNPNIIAIKEFNEVYEKETKGKTNKGRQGLLMWAIALLVDKHPDNPYKNLCEDDRRTLIKEDYLKDPNFDWSKVEDLVKVYKTFCLSPVDRALLQIENKLEERTKMIDDTPYNIGNAEDLDKLILKTKPLKDLYKEMKSELEMEQSSDGVIRGGRKESISEKGAI